jgi:hypothetical protein
MFNSEEVNTSKMTSDLTLLRREVINGPITKQSHVVKRGNLGNINKSLY